MGRISGWAYLSLDVCREEVRKVGSVSAACTTKGKCVRVRIGLDLVCRASLAKKDMLILILGRYGLDRNETGSKQRVKSASDVANVDLKD